MEEKIRGALSGVKYPGFDKDIVSLGMVEEITLDGSTVTVKMKKLSAGENVKKELADEIVATLAGISLKAEVRFPDEQPSDKPKAPPSKQEITGVKKIIPVASGKGGVGKSTVSVNLAIALAKEGNRVGLLDLDVYGPSVPTMLGLDGMHDVGENNRLLPKEKYGLKIISIGLLMEKDAPLIWRGPMVMKIVRQMLYDVDWGELDYLVLDLPPGTGDVQLTLVQSIPITGAVIVTTPQDVALADAKKAFNMFKKTDTRVIGIIENMSIFVCPHCKKESSIFGSGGGKRESELLNVPLLGEIPLDAVITSTGDSGNPVTLSENGPGKIFREIAAKVAKATT